MLHIFIENLQSHTIIKTRYCINLSEDLEHWIGSVINGCAGKQMSSSPALEDGTVPVAGVLAVQW